LLLNRASLFFVPMSSRTSRYFRMDHLARDRTKNARIENPFPIVDSTVIRSAAFAKHLL
jgi:hypothetical protein